ncbi:pectate lyase [Dickeya zeae]|uniref:pectate lyase n=1 Tax=Dickeya zeae TaxID=204042 RepID=UPI0020BE479C|nr:pectate lyase [Dickeya zeae]
MADINITLSLPSAGLNGGLGGVGGADNLNNGLGGNGLSGNKSSAQDNKLLEALAVIMTALLPSLLNNKDGQSGGDSPLGRTSDGLGGGAGNAQGGGQSNGLGDGLNSGLSSLGDGAGANGNQGQNGLTDMLTKLLDLLMPKNGAQGGQGLQGSGLDGSGGAGGASGPGGTGGLEDLSKSLLQDSGENSLGNGISPTQDGGGQISDNPLVKILMALVAMLMENQKNQFGQPQDGAGNNSGGGSTPSVGGSAGGGVSPSVGGGASPSVGGSNATGATGGSGTVSTGSAGKSGPVSFPAADNANAIVVNEPIKVGPGEVFDGKGKTYVADPALGDGGQKEGQKPLFEVADGGSVKNVIFGNNAADGIHLHGDAKIDNVHWTNVGEDALTVKSNTGKPANVSITNSSAQGASDKIFQLNADANFNVDNFKAKDFGTFVRTNGGQQGNWNLNLSNIDAQNGKFSFVKSDSEGLNVKVNNANLDNVNNHYKVPKSTNLQVS